jgi:hypothetical protein
MTLVEILQAIETLDASEQDILLKRLQRTIVNKQPHTHQSFILDMHPGAMIAADDFDEELPDSFWLGDA